MAEDRKSRRQLLEDLRSLLDPLVRRFGYGLGTVFFIPNPWIGLIFWAALFSSPRLGLFALLGLVVGALLQRLLNLENQSSLGGGVKANALLTAAATAWLFSAQAMPLWAELLLASAAAGMSALIAAASMAMLGKTRFPAMLIGYCMVASMLFVLCPQCTVSAASLMEPWTVPVGPAGWLAAFTRSLGSLVYSPSIAFGSLVCLAFLLWSRAAFLAGVVGWLGGVAVSLACLGLGFNFFYLPLSYNFFMAGVALGAAFYLPGWVTLAVAAVAGAFCAVLALCLQVVTAGGAIAYLPLASMLTVWVGIGAIGLAGQRAIARRYPASRFAPEIVWLKEACLARRFGDPDPLLAIPLAGTVYVSQGFSGDVTHTGKWRHALDFQMVDTNGQRNPIYGAQVLAPGSGVIEAVKNTVPDNVIGGSDFRDNWGNHVIIRLDRGGWVLLGHLLQNSIGVSVGMRVQTGSLLGRVGNSGRSPVPHLHLQFQTGPEAGAPTAPFKLANYLALQASQDPWSQWVDAGVPGPGDFLRAALPNPPVYEILTRMMPGSAVWFCEITGDVPQRFVQANIQRTTRVQILLDDAGRYRFDAGKGGALLAGLEPDAWRITELERVQAPLLSFLGMSVPSIPYAVRVGTTWEDVPPVALNGMGFAESFAPYLGRRFDSARYICKAVGEQDRTCCIEAEFAARGPISPVATTCRFEHLRGPVSLRVAFPHGAIEFSLLSFEPGLSSRAAP